MLLSPGMLPIDNTKQKSVETKIVDHLTVQGNIIKSVLMYIFLAVTGESPHSIDFKRDVVLLMGTSINSNFLHYAWSYSFLLLLLIIFFFRNRRDRFIYLIYWGIWLSWFVVAVCCCSFLLLLGEKPKYIYI